MVEFYFSTTWACLKLILYFINTSKWISSFKTFYIVLTIVLFFAACFTSWVQVHKTIYKLCTLCNTESVMTKEN